MDFLRLPTLHLSLTLLPLALHALKDIDIYMPETAAGPQDSKTAFIYTLFTTLAIDEVMYKNYTVSPLFCRSDSVSRLGKGVETTHATRIKSLSSVESIVGDHWTGLQRLFVLASLQV